MQVYNLDREAAQAIHAYRSHDVSIIKVSRAAASAHISMLHFDPGGVIGCHQAEGDQLFLVVQGEGWVTGVDRHRVMIKTGQAVSWEKGEWHESGSEKGMTVVVVEADELQPLLPLFEPS